MPLQTKANHMAMDDDGAGAPFTGGPASHVAKMGGEGTKGCEQYYNLPHSLNNCN